MPRLLAALLVLVTLAPPTAGGQSPHRAHRTISTAHFRVHFERALEPLARRAAASAERAYERLAMELVAPRGPIDLVLSDNVDYANGSATVFPSNRIVVYVHPPIESRALRNADDWVDLVVSHELAHIFHLDRTRGTWRLLQGVFGRSPLFFPNAYSPRWLTEGIATYYESRLTSSGRVLGKDHRAHLLTAGTAGRFPRIDQVSVATPVFPGGQGVYIFGSMFVQHIADTRGDRTIPALIERQAVQPIPFLIDRAARDATGQGLRASWRDFARHYSTFDTTSQLPIAEWRDLGEPMHSADFLRWMDDGRLVFTGSAPRKLYGAYALTPDVPETFLGRRNGATPHSRTADGTLVYAQPDYTDPYTLRGDLYIERPGRGPERVTRSARLSAPDVRADGRVVAVQALAGGSRLVTYDLATRTLVPLTSGGMDEFWAEPRWSPDGRRIAAARWERGGVTSIAIVNPDSMSLVMRCQDDVCAGESTARILEEISRARGVQGSPTWTPDGRSLLFVSDRDRSRTIYLVEVGSGRPPIGITTGWRANDVSDPQLSPDGRTLAAVRLTAEGMRVGIAPALITMNPPRDSIGEPVALGARLDTVTPHDGPVLRYSPIRQLAPRYWFPLFEDDGRDTRAGAYTSSSDILGRHSYVAQASVPLRGRGIEGGFSYQYAGFSRPLLGISAWQGWSYRGSVLDRDDRPIARIDRLERDFALSATFARPRVRSNLQLTVSAGAEVRRNSMDADLPTNAPPDFFADSVLPRVTVGVGYARTRSAPYAISPEDGFTASAGIINRWVAGEGPPTARTVTGALTGYRSFDLGGYARHVAAVRVAAGAADDHAMDELEVGGVSGTAVPLAFGLGEIGEGRRTFPVRGFDGRTLYGTRAVAASLEYRAPLALLARGAGLLPLFLDRTSITAFTDAASAWCPNFRPGLCAQGNPRATIASAGAEVRLVAALGSWDQPFAFRLGIAAPVMERDRAGRPVSVYFTSGLSF